MPDTPAAATLRPGRGLRLALAASVALNLAVLGLIGGVMLGHGGPGGRGPAVRDLGFGPFTEALTPADRTELRLRFLADNARLGPERRAARAETQALLDVLRADPFDATALDAAMQAQAARMESRLRLGQTLIGAYLAEMSTADRRAFADRLEATLQRRGPKPPSD